MAEHDPARVRCQMVLVAGLTRDAATADLVDELDQLGVLDHPGVRRLLDLARALDDGLPVDAMAWLERAREEAPALADSLERALFPGPGVVLPEPEDAADYLRRELAHEQEAQARREALARADLAQDDAALRALQESLAARAAARGRPPNSLSAER